VVENSLNIETMNLFKSSNKTFNEVLPDFLSEKEIEVSHKSLLTYTGKSTIFNHWLESKRLNNASLRKINPEHMAKFFLYLAKDRHLDRPTCEKYFLTLRSIWKFAIKRRYADELPFDLITFPVKGEDKSSEVISHDHLKLLLTDMKESDPQLYLACMMEYYCFIRPGTELRLLKVGDVDTEQGTIQVSTEHAKNGHKRIVTMPTQLIELCKEYGIDNADKNLYVFGKHRKLEDKPVSINMLRYRFNKIRDGNNLSKKYKFYSFKCSGATALHNSNVVSLRGLMDQLGHSRLSATEHYIKRYAGVVNNSIRESFPNPM
jgi:site-specific recombinase XerD